MPFRSLFARILGRSDPDYRRRSSACQVANYILEQHHLKYQYHATPQQIQKLVYFSHAWMLGIHGRPLLNKPADGWQYGPYFHDLYREQRKIHGAIAFPVHKASPFPFDPVETAIMDQVFITYGHLTGPQLGDRCNGPGTPWDQAWLRQQKANGQPKSRRIQIPDQALQTYYSQLWQRHQADQAKHEPTQTVQATSRA